MGKKNRRTRWRTLTITDEHSDSEESNTTSSGHRVPKGYPQKSYYSRFTYSSQSTPTRRYQCDGTKSTRSSSTASENKTTFNEDEYTRITTPRQDVLFKKGYLNKPKSYQTQTSTGNSTTSTGNSTGNGTPDHQSTGTDSPPSSIPIDSSVVFPDLEYESQFVFPNGFVDQNGIYYVNSFEPYPVMVYNPPTYYPEYTHVKTKRSSTGSLTESTSPNNEETSQDLRQCETPSGNDLNHHHHVYNVVYHPGYYYGGDAGQPQDAVNEPEPRRVKKRRRRKLSRSKQDGTTSESSDEEEETKTEDQPAPEKPIQEETIAAPEVVVTQEEEASPEKEAIPEEEAKPTSTQPENSHETDENTKQAVKYDLKPDAEEFVPRAYRHPETIPLEANVQFIKIPPNFVPVPIIGSMGEYANAFIPPGIPINFIPQNFVNFVPYKHPMQQTEEEKEEEQDEKKEETTKETVEVPKNQIDIARIVSKLEEAAKEQDDVKEEPTKIVAKKRHKFQKVELRREVKMNSPKKEEPKVVRNYSETLKKSIVQPRIQEKTKSPVKEVRRNVERLVPKTNEWIPVSRKKRKNKNVEEFDEENTEKEPKEEVVEEKLEEPAPVPEETVLPPQLAPPPPPPTIVEVETPKSEDKKTKKRAKKSQVKATPPRRIMITDVDLTQREPQEEPKKEEKIEEPLPAPVEEIKIEKEEVKIDEIKIEPLPEEEEESKEPGRKSRKKKKKPPTKPSIQSSQSSSNATLNVLDDLLLDESLERTNVEVSQELDKLIQRGMYNNLEEKIKAMNIDSNDNFFKSLITNISSRESSVEKTTTIKNSGFGLYPNLIPPAQTRKNDFLAEPTTPDEIGGGGESNEDILYPITKAVKEWMTRTRENTPDVEIFKSPSTLFKEFGAESEDEVTVYEARKSSTSSVEEAEEVYESLYGKNEEYLKIQAEVQELRNNYPKHGNLPYRAICCSIM